MSEFNGQISEFNGQISEFNGQIVYCLILERIRWTNQ